MNFTKRFLRNNWDVFLFVFIMVIKLLTINTTLKLRGYSQYTVMGCLGSVLILVGLACLLKRKIRIPVLFVFNIIVTLIIYIDNVYNRYFLDVTTIGLLKQTGLAGDVSGSIFSLISPIDIFFVLDIIILLILYTKFRKRIKGDSSNFVIRFVSSAVIIILGFVLSVGSVNGLNKTQNGILKTFYDKKAVVRDIGLLNYHMIDIKKYLDNNVFKRTTITNEEKYQVKSFFEEKNKENKQTPKYYGIAKGKNLIVIQLEAFQSFVLNKKINGVEITPNLNKLAKESLNFNNYYYQTSLGGTSDAEFLTNTSLLPAKEVATYYQYSNNEFKSLPILFKENGYVTSVMHANRPGFWNRQNMYNTLGFDAYESEKNYNIDDVKILGLSDKSFFRQNIDKLKNSKSPFYSFMISLTSHYPFNDRNDPLKGTLDVGDLEGTLVGDFMKTAKYTDEALGEFLESLKREGLYDNTVIALYGDHSAISSDKRDQLAKAAYGKSEISDLEWQEAQKVVGMIHVPGSNLKGDINTAAGQYDLYPTLANLFGLKADYALGQDLLNTTEGFVVTRGGNFYLDNAIYVKSEDKIYDKKTGQELNKSDYKKYFDKMNTYFNVADKVLENNLIKEFNSK